MNPTTRQIIGHAVLESLEDRRLMSAVNVVGGTVVLQGSPRGNNKLSVALDPGGKTLFVRANKLSAHVLTSSIKTIRVIGGEACDWVTIDPALKLPAYVRTGAGADTITTANGNDTILAGHGNDVIRTNGGDDFINDGPGADSVIAGNGDDPDSVGTRPGSSYTVAVKSFTLIDSVTNQPIGTLLNGAVINLATLTARHLNVTANLSGASSGSVRFTYDGADLPLAENGAPYALAHDNNGNYQNWDPRLGTHTLTATPYSAKSGAGTAGTSSTITFTVIDDPTAHVVNPGAGGTGITPDGSGSGTGTNTGGTGTNNNNNNGGGTTSANSPVAAISVLESTIHVGQSVHVNGLSSQLKGGDVLGAKYDWTFGDDAAEYNKLTGFNAAHVYDRAGTYTITLKLTNAAGKTAFATTKVTVKAAERRFVYVSNNGNDSNTGTSSTQAVKTFARAAQLIGDNTELLFERGDTFNLTSGMGVGFKNLAIGAYGTGAKPVLKYVGTLHAGSAFFTANDNSDGVTIRGLSFDSKYSTGYEGMPVGVRAGGKNITVRENFFGNVADGINSNNIPDGVLALNNTAGTGIRGYFAWVQGADQVYLGNKVGDSRYQHVIRSAGVDRMLIAYNDFANPYSDSGIMKATLNIHKGNYLYIAHNTLNDGKVCVGPLGEKDGMADMAGRTNWVVVEQNDIHSPIRIEHGAEHVMVRNNLIDYDGAAAFQVEGFNTTYQRGSSDLYLVHNTVLNSKETGSFIQLLGPVDGITMTNNLYIAPNLKPGEFQAAAVTVCESDLSSFRLISDNVWPAAKGMAYAQGGINFIGKAMQSAGYQDPAEWEALPQVKHDQFKSYTIGSSYLVSLGGITAGADLKAA
jgi:hypothetical protein